MAKLLLVHWDEEEAVAWAGELQPLGWEIRVEWAEGSDAYRTIRDWEPDVVVVSLERKPSHAVRIAETVRRSRWGHETPFVFVAGNDEDALMTLRDDLPEATYVERDELPAALRALQTD